MFGLFKSYSSLFLVFTYLSIYLSVWGLFAFFVYIFVFLDFILFHCQNVLAGDTLTWSSNILVQLCCLWL